MKRRIKAAAGTPPRRVVADLAARPVVTFFMAMISLALTVTVGLGAYFFHVQDVNREKDRLAATAQAGQAIRIPICYLVYTYVHPAPDSPVNVRSVQVQLAWAGLGKFQGCPDGIKPPNVPVSLVPTPTASPS